MGCRNATETKYAAWVEAVIYYGIDCGVSGGIAQIKNRNDISLYSFKDCTIKDIVGLFSMIFGNDGDERFVIVERVHAMPSKFRGCSTSWTLAESFSVVRTLLAVEEVPYELVLPQTWQKAMRCKFDKSVNYTKRKKLLMTEAQSLFPNLQDITRDTADALLIAEYCRRVHK